MNLCLLVGLTSVSRKETFIWLLCGGLSVQWQKLLASIFPSSRCHKQKRERKKHISQDILALEVVRWDFGLSAFGRKASEALGNRWIKKILGSYALYLLIQFSFFSSSNLWNLECFSKLSEMDLFLFNVFPQTERGFKAEQMVEIWQK